jgi:hypothetical protein
VPADVAPPLILTQAMRLAIDDAVAAVPSGKKGQAGVAVTTNGVQFDVGYKPKTWLSVGAFASRAWGGAWSAGARAGVVW